MDFVCTVVQGPATETLESLSDWIEGDVSLKARLTPVRRPPRPTEMGAGPWDVLAISVGSGGAVTALVAALRAWILLPQSVGLRIRIEDRADGTRAVEIDAERARVTDIGDLVAHLACADERDDATP